MLILDTTTKSLEVKLGAAPGTQFPWTASFADITTSTFVPASSHGVTTGVTAVTMVAAPGASTQRQVKYLSIFNADSVARDVTVQLNDSATLRTICKVTLETGEQLSYTDGHGFKVITAMGAEKTAANYTDEQAQDAVGTVLVDTATIDFAYDDPTPQITADVKDDSITDAKLRESAGFSVIGKSTTGTGNPADIVAADETVLGRTAAGNLVFAQVATGQVANDAITDAKLRNSAGFSVIGKATTGSGDPADIVAGTDSVLGRSGSADVAFFARAGVDTDAIHDNVASEISAIAEKTAPVSADLVVIEDSAAGNAKKRVQIGNLGGGFKFVRGGTVLTPAVANIIVWRAPFACTVTNVRGYRVGGTGATINARLNGASNHLSSALSLTSADTWMDGGAVQNTAYAAGDRLEIMIVTVTGSPTQLAVQVDFTKN